jgi:hypothetical protein
MCPTIVKGKMSFTDQCELPCVCCTLEYDNFDRIAAHKGIGMIAPPPYSSIAPTTRVYNYFLIDDKKTKYFHNNTMTNYNVVVVRTMCEDLPQYSPAIRLQVSTVRQPVPIMILKTGEYMRIKTVKKYFILYFTLAYVLLIGFFFGFSRLTMVNLYCLRISL